MTLSRRALLSGAASVPVASAAALLRQDSSDAVFEDAVRQIAGVPGIASAMVRIVRDAFVAKFGGPALLSFCDAVRGRPIDDAAASGNSVLAEQVRFIALILFTGEIDTGGRKLVPLYPWSLAWATLGFAKAPGLCGGPAFGHWEKAP